MTMNCKSRSRIGLLMLALMPGLAQAAGPSPVGNWLRGNRTVKIAVTQCGSDYCAVNTWVKRPEGKEKVGDKLVLSVKPVSDTEYKGTAFDVKRQATYKMTITFDGNNMVTSGCVLLGIVCKSTTWTRID